MSENSDNKRDRDALSETSLDLERQSPRRSASRTRQSEPIGPYQSARKVGGNSPRRAVGDQPQEAVGNQPHQAAGSSPPGQLLPEDQLQILPHEPNGAADSSSEGTVVVTHRRITKEEMIVAAPTPWQTDEVQAAMEQQCDDHVSHRVRQMELYMQQQAQDQLVQMQLQYQQEQAIWMAQQEELMRTVIEDSKNQAYAETLLTVQSARSAELVAQQSIAEAHIRVGQNETETEKMLLAIEKQNNASQRRAQQEIEDLRTSLIVVNAQQEQAALNVLMAEKRVQLAEDRAEACSINQNDMAVEQETIHSRSPLENFAQENQRVLESISEKCCNMVSRCEYQTNKELQQQQVDIATISQTITKLSNQVLNVLQKVDQPVSASSSRLPTLLTSPKVLPVAEPQQQQSGNPFDRFKKPEDLEPRCRPLCGSAFSRSNY